MSSKNDLQKVGWDPGFGRTKMAWVNGQVNVVEFPSVVGVGKISQGALSLAGFDQQGRTVLPNQVSFQGMDYLVGAGVAGYARPIERMDMARFAEGTELRALLYTALSLLGVTGGQVSLAIGLPVEMLRDKAQATVTEKAMNAWLIGKHRWVLDGREQAVEIVKARASVAQPLGGWLDWGLSTEGQWVRGPEGRRAPVLVVDQGFNTLDIFGVEDGRPSPRYTSGDTLGMRRAAELVKANVRRRHNQELGLHEADNLLRVHLEGKSPIIHVHGEPADVTAEIIQALNAIGSEVINFIDSVIGREANKFRILLVGGGALALSDRLTRQYPHAEMAAAPTLANARGLGKLAISGYLG